MRKKIALLLAAAMVIAMLPAFSTNVFGNPGHSYVTTVARTGLGDQRHDFQIDLSLLNGLSLDQSGPREVWITWRVTDGDFVPIAGAQTEAYPFPHMFQPIITNLGPLSISSPQSINPEQPSIGGFRWEDSFSALLPNIPGSISGMSGTVQGFLGVRSDAGDNRLQIVIDEFIGGQRVGGRTLLDAPLVAGVTTGVTIGAAALTNIGRTGRVGPITIRENTRGQLIPGDDVSVLLLAPWGYRWESGQLMQAVGSAPVSITGQPGTSYQGQIADQIGTIPFFRVPQVTHGPDAVHAVNRRDGIIVSFTVPDRAPGPVGRAGVGQLNINNLWLVATGEIPTGPQSIEAFVAQYVGAATATQWNRAAQSFGPLLRAGTPGNHAGLWRNLNLVVANAGTTTSMIVTGPSTIPNIRSGDANAGFANNHIRLQETVVGTSLHIPQLYSFALTQPGVRFVAVRYRAAYVGSQEGNPTWYEPWGDFAVAGNQPWMVDGWAGQWGTGRFPGRVPASWGEGFRTMGLATRQLGNSAQRYPGTYQATGNPDDPFVIINSDFDVIPGGFHTHGTGFFADYTGENDRVFNFHNRPVAPAGGLDSGAYPGVQNITPRWMDFEFRVEVSPNFQYDQVEVEVTLPDGTSETVVIANAFHPATLESAPAVHVEGHGLGMNFIAPQELPTLTLTETDVSRFRPGQFVTVALVSTLNGAIIDYRHAIAGSTFHMGLRGGSITANTAESGLRVGPQSVTTWNGFPARTVQINDRTLNELGEITFSGFQAYGAVIPGLDYRLIIVGNGVNAINWVGNLNGYRYSATALTTEGELVGDVDFLVGPGDEDAPAGRGTVLMYEAMAPVSFVDAEGAQVVANPFRIHPTVGGQAVSMVSPRWVAYLVGADASWNAATSTFTMTRGAQSVALTIDSPMALVNGQQVDIATFVGGASGPAGTVTALNLDGRMMLPVRFLADAFGYEIGFDAGVVALFLD